MVSSDYSESYDPDRDFDRIYTIAAADRIRAFLRPGDHVLELGCATGLMSSELSKSEVHILGVDRSEAFLGVARSRNLTNTSFERGDIEAYDAQDSHFDHVIITSVLHEVRDPLGLLRKCASAVKRGGFVHLTLQNPESIHRLTALELGLIESTSQVADRGRQWGTTRLWSAPELRDLAAAADLDVVIEEGLVLKPLPNALMECLPAEVIEGFVKVARIFPRHCAMNYLVLRPTTRKPSSPTC